MERGQEIAKLVNVLRRTSRMAMQSEWTGSGQDAATYCVEQYNRVLARLKEIDPDLATVFTPLQPGSSLTVAAMACRQLAAYYEDEVSRQPGFKFYGAGFDTESFKDFWHKSAREIEDLGEYIREGIEEWTRQRKKQKPETAEHEAKKTTNLNDEP